MISIIVAADTNGAIGAKNRIPWRLRDDLVRLKQLTLGHTVILGRKSYDSMVDYYNKSGRPMPGSTYIVITRNKEYQPERDNGMVAHSIDEAVALAKQLGDDNILVIGGGDIFKAALPLADRIYYTEVQTQVEPGDVDAYFPKLDMADWTEVSRTRYDQDDRNEFAHDFMEYQRR